MAKISNLEWPLCFRAGSTRCPTSSVGTPSCRKNILQTRKSALKVLERMPVKVETCALSSQFYKFSSLYHLFLICTGWVQLLHYLSLNGRDAFSVAWPTLFNAIKNHNWTVSCFFMAKEGWCSSTMNVSTNESKTWVDFI